MKAALFVAALLFSAVLCTRGADPFADTQSKEEAAAAFADVEKQLAKKDANGLRSLYREWKSRFNLSYTPSEESQRYANFEATLRRIIKNNRDVRSTYWSGLNQFSAMSDAEFKASFLGLVKGQNGRHAPTASLPRGRSLLQQSLPRSKNWAAEGRVTPVKNQGSCGACWAWAGAAAIEARVLVALGKKFSEYAIDVSEQQLVDCARGAMFPYSFGCSGGQLEDPFRYAAINFATQEAIYRLTGADGSCKAMPATSGRVVLSGNGFTTLENNSATVYKQALQTSPFSIGLYASDPSFRSYKGGIYNPAVCGGTDMVDHAVLLVGYDEVSEAWLLKNSWGAT
ncbi:hypothetical protein N2152v2_006833 [Parachlorella kessleri]